MKKITETIANAFAKGAKKSIGNTMTDGNAVFLHGNKIAEWREDGLHMSLAGWNTVTTRERLNGIAQVLGLKVSFTQKAFEPYLNRKLIDDNAWHNVRQAHLDNKTSYYIKQADIAHELYAKSKGGYKNEWQGAAIGFKRVLSDRALFNECLSKADKILKAD